MITNNEIRTMKNNIFTYEGAKGELIETFYNLLVKGDVVSYESILTSYDGGKLTVNKVSAHEQYNTLKKVVPKVVDTFISNGLSVVTIPEGRNTSYQYVGSNTDPLKNFRFKALINERYNILSECIANRCSVRMSYWPFDRKKMEITFHPHLLYGFNGRMFVFGVSEKKGKEPFRRFCMALDRIDGEIMGANATYIPAVKDEYKYLAHLVGVRFEKGAELTKIRLRAHDRYTFGRLTTKPIHDSQAVIESPNLEEGRESGDVEIQVYPNVELIGQILSYGNKLEVMSPEEFRLRVKHEVEAIYAQYNDEDNNSSCS